VQDCIPQYLTLLPDADHKSIRYEHQKKQTWINQSKKGFLRYREPLDRVRHLRASTVDCTGDSVQIGKKSDLSPQEHEQVLELMRTFIPWRKGPFSVFDISIDAEWQSQRKWNRLLPELPDLKDKIIADIGCNNGYYMFRMAAHQPKLVLGFEPYVQHYYTFSALNTFAGLDNLCIDLLGIEHLPLFPNVFDVIFCLGILYHRPSPIDSLRDLHTALKPGGCLLIESQAINAEQPLPCFPGQPMQKYREPGLCPHHPVCKTGLSELVSPISNASSATR